MFKYCEVCGTKFEDNTYNNTKKYCSLNCKKKFYRKYAKDQRDSLKPKFKVQDVCKKCKLRRDLCNAVVDENYTNWNNSYCSYLEQTGMFRECEPTKNSCDKFVPRY